MREIKFRYVYRNVDTDKIIMIEKDEVLEKAIEVILTEETS